MTRKTKDLLNSLITDRTEEEIWQAVSAGGHTQLSPYNRFKKAVSVEIGVPYETVYRMVYDDYLVRYYLEKGGTLMDGKLPTRLDAERREIELRTGELLTYDYLIAADGANSWVGHQLGLTFGGKLFCLEINVSREDFDYEDIGIYFDVIGVGYAWVFPKNDLYCIGIGSTEKPKKDTKAIFSDFLQRIGVRNLEKYPFQGAFVPGGGFLKKPVFGERMLFVGDAAGFADPLTGEGLYWSMYSGIQAAEAISAAYGKKMGNGLGKDSTVSMKHAEAAPSLYAPKGHVDYRQMASAQADANAEVNANACACAKAKAKAARGRLKLMEI